MSDEPMELMPEEPKEGLDTTDGEFTSGEGLVAFGAIVLVAVWLIFDLFLDNYGMNNTIAVVAAAAALLPRIDRNTVEKFHPLPLLMKVLGYTLALFGAVELLLDLRFNSYGSFGTVVGALAAYAGFVMCYMGARQIEA